MASTPPKPSAAHAEPMKAGLYDPTGTLIRTIDLIEDPFQPNTYALGEDIHTTDGESLWILDSHGRLWPFPPPAKRKAR